LHRRAAPRTDDDKILGELRLYFLASLASSFREEEEEVEEEVRIAKRNNDNDDNNKDQSSKLRTILPGRLLHSQIRKLRRLRAGPRARGASSFTTTA
jgi:hypothetical protein